jgi:hypothetical protein
LRLNIWAFRKTAIENAVAEVDGAGYSHTYLAISAESVIFKITRAVDHTVTNILIADLLALFWQINYFLILLTQYTIIILIQLLDWVSFLLE